MGYFLDQMSDADVIWRTNRLFLAPKLILAAVWRIKQGVYAKSSHFSRRKTLTRVYTQKKMGDRMVAHLIGKVYQLLDNTLL